MRSARVLAPSAAAIIGLLAAGCGSSDSGDSKASGNTGSSGKTPKIAYITYADTDFVQAETEGLKEVAAKSGGTVTVLNANFDPQKQLKQCSDAITSGRYNAIVLGAVDPATGVPCVKQAAAAKIPVGTIETAVGTDPTAIGPQVDGVVATMTNGIETNAQGEADLVKKACEGIDPCKVIAEVATPSDRFTNTAMDAVKKLGGNVKVVQTVSGQYDPSVIAKVLPDALSAHPDADVFASAADSQVIAALAAVKDAGMVGKIKLIGNGGSRQGAKAIADGTMFGTMGNWPRQGGVILATGVIQALNGEQVTKPSNDGLKIRTPFLLYKSDIGQFTAEWGAK